MAWITLPQVMSTMRTAPCLCVARTFGGSLRWLPGHAYTCLSARRTRLRPFDAVSARCTAASSSCMGVQRRSTSSMTSGAPARQTGIQSSAGSSSRSRASSFRRGWAACLSSTTAGGFRSSGLSCGWRSSPARSGRWSSVGPTFTTSCWASSRKTIPTCNMLCRCARSRSIWRPSCRCRPASRGGSGRRRRFHPKKLVLLRVRPGCAAPWMHRVPRSRRHARRAGRRLASKAWARVGRSCRACHGAGSICCSGTGRWPAAEGPGSWLSGLCRRGGGAAGPREGNGRRSPCMSGAPGAMPSPAPPPAL
mmetsp:Transcript_64759/g.192964  ORF Transcript_64759/g.192964 Transcript_64759/m.192964 type:complete len:307 (+) Transcript_64759:176-1096(+)